MEHSPSQDLPFLQRAVRLLTRAALLALCAGAVALAAGFVGSWLRTLPPDSLGVGVLTLLIAALALSLVSVHQRLSVRAAHRLAARVQRSVLRRRDRFERLVNSPNDLVFVRERDGRLRYANEAATLALGYNLERLCDAAPFSLVASEDVAVVERFFQNEVLARPGLSRPLEFAYVDRRGAAHAVRATFNNLLDDPDVAGIVEVAQDIAERRELERELLNASCYDALTGLPNRATFLQTLETRAAAAGEAPIALLLVDIDRFKLVNDSLGRSAGDALLGALARRLEACVRSADLLARLDGDEFALLLAGAAAERIALRVAERIANRLSESFNLAGHEVFAGASIGIALANTPQTGEELLRRADVALHRAKQAGRGRAVVYGVGADEGLDEQLQLAAELRRALQREEFHVVYQPEVDLRTGAICGVEALLRWQHPTRGLLLPSEFLPLAEQAGLIGPVGRWLLVQACKDAAGWRARGRGERPLLCVNLSAHEFLSDELVDNIATVLHTSGLNPSALRLEVTERAVIQDVEAAARAMRAVQRLGPQFAIDDFGTGYGSLMFLHRLPFDALKLDGDLVRAVDRDPRTRVIAGAAIDLAHELAMTVIAEGVETASQLAALRELGCDRGHGYYVAAPVPADALEALLGSGPIVRGLPEVAQPVGAR